MAYSEKLWRKKRWRLGIKMEKGDKKVEEKLAGRRKEKGRRGMERDQGE